MKSNPEKLKERGMINQEEIILLSSLSKDELIHHMPKSPSIRSACIRLLSKKYHNDNDYTQILLNQLTQETALYTKIEIQNQLSLYGNISLMCQYLGEIGTNQYRTIPKKVSLKKSYPLPRDIIARSLAHMNIKHFHDFLVVIPQLSKKQLLEAIDALGFICFYHNQLADEQSYSLVYQLYQNYSNDELMVWKIVTCLSAFPQSHDFLLELKQMQKHPTILMEVGRSLKLITR